MTSSELVWVDLALVLIIHERSLAHHGGAEGIRDSGALESALALPQNLSLDESPSLSEPAANYLFGMVKNHAFVDGNKRTAWVTARTFLALNGVSLQFDALEAITFVESVAAGAVDRAAATIWFEERIA